MSVLPSVFMMSMCHLWVCGCVCGWQVHKIHESVAVCMMRMCSSWVCMCDSWMCGCLCKYGDSWVHGCLGGWQIQIQIQIRVVLCVLCYSRYCISIHKIVDHSSWLGNWIDPLMCMLCVCVCVCVCARACACACAYVCAGGPHEEAIFMWYAQLDVSGISCIYLRMTFYLNLFVCCCCN